MNYFNYTTKSDWKTDFEIRKRYNKNMSSTPKSYYTYVLHCADNTLYCGYTDDVEKRLAAHNAAKGAKYTKGRLPVELLSAVEFDNKSDATKCEWWFKNKLQRAQKLELIHKKQIKSAYEAYKNERKQFS